MKKLIIGTLAFSAAGALSGGGATIALAQPAATPMVRDKVMTRADVVAHVQKLFARLDANHDGVITPDELAAARGGGMDHHAGEGAAGTPDGQTMGDGGAHRHMGRGMGARMLAMADANHDGRITLEEATAAALRHFDMLDTNHDGQVTPDEREAARLRMGDNH